MKITDDMLTEWFPADVYPTHTGVYEVENLIATSVRFFCHWNPDGWSWCRLTPDDANLAATDEYRTAYRCWRGLNKEPQRD